MLILVCGRPIYLAFKSVKIKVKLKNKKGIEMQDPEQSIESMEPTGQAVREYRAMPVVDPSLVNPEVLAEMRRTERRPRPPVQTAAQPESVTMPPQE
jgi:hypothetical protein